MPFPPIKASVAVVSVVFSGVIQAATVNVGPLQTSHSGVSSTINSSVSATRNLSDLTGLTPGQSIQISFTPSDVIAWEGSFFYNDGILEINWSAQVEISVGGQTMTYTDLWNFGPSPAMGGSEGVSGNTNGALPTTHSFVVPWGTDLSSVSIVLRDLSTIDGTAGASFTTSEMTISGVLVTTSVPEPSGAIFLGFGPAVMLLRRRRA